MTTYTLTGSLFAEMVKSGAANLRNNAQTVNQLNVFPIPDGDTGDNMSRTIEGGAVRFTVEDAGDLGEVAGRLAEGMLLSARGNSGVILSQFFEGLRRGLENLTVADAKLLAEAFKSGVHQAYSSVVKPTEGTILTVMREATEYAASNTVENASLEAFFEAYIKEMYASLDRTPELLPILKESGVIDSGGAGFVYIIEGMNRALRGQSVTPQNGESAVSSSTSNDTDINFDRDSEMKFGYCTELILQLQDRKTNVNAFSVDQLISHLEYIGGDSIVAFKTGTRVKLHVHTFEPNKVLDYCLSFGEFISVKIENMSIQHNETTIQNRFERQTPITAPSERKKFGLVSVAEGAGLIEAFTSFGCDYVVNGNQTMNPSTEDFLTAFEAVNADTIFVLPNNSNIILAATQAANLFEGSNVVVVPSKTIAEGYAAMTMFDYSSEDIEIIVDGMQMAIDNVTTGLVTYAVSDCSLNDISIRKNDFLGFCGKELVSDERTRVAAACRLLDRIDKTGKEVIIIICGHDATESDAKAVREYVKVNFPKLEIFEIDGGQDVYSFIFAIE